MIAYALECERCSAPNAEQAGLAFLCAECVFKLGLCAHCRKDDATVTLDDERVCDSCWDDAMEPEYCSSDREAA